MNLHHNTLPPATVLIGHWDTQIGDYAATGTPGFQTFQAVNPRFPDAPIDCLLLRDPSGALIGILHHYGPDLQPDEEAGNVSLWIRPDVQGRGLGTWMLLLAMDLWPDIDLHRQSYTPAGRKLAARCLALRARAVAAPAPTS